MESRTRPWWISPVPIAVGAATFLSLLGDGRDGFWANHPMLGALVSGGLLFAAGAFIVERFVERRNARRWAAAAIAADRDLGHVLNEALTAMWTAHSDADPRGSERSQQDWTPASRAKAPTRSGVSAFDTTLPPPNYSGAALTPQERLVALLVDPEYVLGARKLIVHHRDAIREAAKGWAGLMMWAEDSQHLLNALGLFAERHLSRVEYHLSCDQQSSEGDPRKTAYQWSLADVKGRILLNTLWGAHTRYRFALPQEAQGVSLKDAFQYDDAVGKWRPAPEGPVPDEDYRLRRASPAWRRVLNLRRAIVHKIGGKRARR